MVPGDISSLILSHQKIYNKLLFGPQPVLDNDAEADKAFFHYINIYQSYIPSFELLYAGRYFFNEMFISFLIYNNNYNYYYYYYYNYN